MKIKKEELKIAAITGRRILLSIVGVGITVNALFDQTRIWRKATWEFRKWREKDSRRFSKALYKLKTQRLISHYIDSKGGEILELTEEGKKRVAQYIFEEASEIKRDEKWDGKWRMVIFDVPETMKSLRDVLRWKLKRLHFYPLQKSVFVYPFDCKEEILLIEEYYGLKDMAQFVLAERIESERKLIKYFVDAEILPTSVRGLKKATIIS